MVTRRTCCWTLEPAGFSSPARSRNMPASPRLARLKCGASAIKDAAPGTWARPTPSRLVTSSSRTARWMSPSSVRWWEDQGLIGADVFQKFLVEIDFPNEKLKLSQLPKRPGEIEQKLALNSQDDDADDSDTPEVKAGAKPAENKTTDAKPPTLASGPQDRYIAPEMQSYTRVLRFGHDLLVPTSIGNVPSKLFLMDTGATMNAISPAAAREVTKVHGNSDMIIKGISGKVNDVFSANKAVLTFGHLRQENQDMTAFDTKNISDSVGTEISGFLGFTILRFLDIKIDYRDALVDFQYDAKRWGR